MCHRCINYVFRSTTVVVSVCFILGQRWPQPLLWQGEECSACWPTWSSEPEQSAWLWSLRCSSWMIHTQGDAGIHYKQPAVFIFSNRTLFTHCFLSNHIHALSSKSDIDNCFRNIDISFFHTPLGINAQGCSYRKTKRVCCDEHAIHAVKHHFLLRKIKWIHIDRREMCPDWVKEVKMNSHATCCIWTNSMWRLTNTSHVYCLLFFFPVLRNKAILQQWGSTAYNSQSEISFIRVYMQIKTVFSHSIEK